MELKKNPFFLLIQNSDQTEEMCNRTSRDQLMVSGNSQLSNDVVSSDSEEFNSEKVDAHEDQINNSNNSSVSLSNLNSLQTQTQQIDNLINGLDSFDCSNTARFLQTMNLLLSSSLQSSNLENHEPLNIELLETIQRLLGQNGNQNLVSNLLAAANQQQQAKVTNWFACKFCTFTTAKRQQLIKHVRTNCEFLLNAAANLTSNNSSTIVSQLTNTTAATTASLTTTTSTATNSTNADCNSPSAEDAHLNEDANNSNASSPNNPNQLASGCGNLVCVNSNCTNNNTCVLLPNLPNASLLDDKLKSIGQAEDSSEDDFTNSANPQDRYCMECEIQFASYKNYRVSFLNLKKKS